MKKIMLVDGNAYVHRAYHSIPLTQNQNGVYVNAIIGFFGYLKKLRQTINPDYIAICFDLPTKNFRHELYPEYKQNRKKMPPKPGIHEQFPLVKRIIKHIGIRYVEQRGFEADDIIGTLSTMANEDLQCHIVSGDRDFMQLINDNVFLYWTNPKGNIAYTRKMIKDQYGIEPFQFIDVKGLMGDKGDNIPGVTGIGPVFAFNLIREYYSIDNLYYRIEDKDLDPKLKSFLIQQKDICYLSRTLGEIKKDLTDISLSCNKYKVFPIDEYNLSKTLEELQLQYLWEDLTS